MRIIERSKAQSSLADYTDQAQEEPVIITVDGKPVAVLLTRHYID